jgi:hypothetical protein
MTQEISGKAILKGTMLFPYFWTCTNSLAYTLCTSPFLCLLSERRGPKRAELVPKGGVSGRCEDFKIIKTCSNQQSPQLSSTCLSMRPTKPWIWKCSWLQKLSRPLCVSSHLIFLPLSPSLGIPNYQIKKVWKALHFYTSSLPLW